MEGAQESKSQTMTRQVQLYYARSDKPTLTVTVTLQ